MNYFAHILTLAACLSVPGIAAAQFTDDTLDALVEAREIRVTIDNFVRAATDIELDKYVTLAGGVNRFFIFGNRHRSTISRRSA
jgi:hypothetical protein